MIYHYIINCEIVILRYFKIDPIVFTSHIALVDLNVYMKKIEAEEKKTHESIKKKDIMKSLKQVCDVLNTIFYTTK